MYVLLQPTVGSNAQVGLGTIASSRRKSVLSEVFPLLPILKVPSFFFFLYIYIYISVYVCIHICV